MQNAKRLVLFGVLVVALAVANLALLPTAATAQSKFKVGFVLVGPKDDKGWNQAHTDAAAYLVKNLPDVETVILDNLNSASRPNVTLEQVVDEMVQGGAKLIYTTSDDFGPDTLKVAEKYPDITFMHVSGSGVLEGKAPKNVGNVMGRMEYMKMIAGCAAALKTEKNSISYLGPLINDETRRLTSSVYLGAKYCFTNYRKLDAKNLKYEVKWIGFWFNIPGVTLDPTAVANSFFDGGADVIISGIDTTEGSAVANQRAQKGEKVYHIPYDYKNACEVAPSICLGSPYFNWGPTYVSITKSVIAGTWKQGWDWLAPDWKDLNNPDTSAVGYQYGDGLSKDDIATLDKFKAGLADGSISLFTGPLNFQDGSVFLKDKETATDKQIWYLPQLLEGMTGASKEEKK